MKIFSTYAGKINMVSPKHKKKFVKGVVKGLLTELNPIHGVKDIISMQKKGRELPRTKNERRADAARIALENKKK